MWALAGLAALIVLLGALLVRHLLNIRNDTLDIQGRLMSIEPDLIRRLNSIEDQLTALDSPPRQRPPTP